MSVKENITTSLEEFETQLKKALQHDFVISYNSLSKNEKTILIAFESITEFGKGDSISIKKTNWQEAFTSVLTQIDELIQTKKEYKEITTKEAEELGVTDNFSEYED